MIENQINTSNKFPYRSFLCYAVLALIMLINLAQLVKNDTKSSSLEQVDNRSPIANTLVEKEFIFAIHYLAKPCVPALESLDSLLKDKVKKYWHTKTEKLSRQKNALFSAAAISIFLEFYDFAPTLNQSLPSGDSLTDLAISLLNDPRKLLSEEEELGLANQSFFGRLIVSKRANDKQTRLDTYRQLIDSATATANRYTTLTTASLFMTIFGLIVAFRFVRQVFKRQLTMSYRLSILPAGIELETFCLYLALMMGLPSLFPLLKEYVNPSYQTLLLSNILAISSMLILLAWPSSAAVPIGNTLSALGITIPPKNIGLSLRFALSAYCAFLPFLFLLLTIYSVFLERVGVDMTEASHPLVNVLLAPGGQSLFFYSLFLAVVVAPLVEEIMFRGFLYNWLRGFCNAFFSIIISSLVFAILHPQGLLGILPLFLIACLLGFLREWKNDLWINIFAHAAVNSGTLILVYTLLL
ncbi:MAG: CPBP family intramembrane metalloprotease [Deltaproteobacteria bacterium]|nr:CPBP family intramembrane metalloprotease [Deltaproteobacteria bacterium]